MVCVLVTCRECSPTFHPATVIFLVGGQVCSGYQRKVVRKWMDGLFKFFRKVKRMTNLFNWIKLNLYIIEINFSVIGFQHQKKQKTENHDSVLKG